MLKYIHIAFVLGIVILSSLGCSRGDADPVTPQYDGIPSITENVTGSGRIQLGIWEIRFDPAVPELTFEPAHHAMAHYNITAYITPPQCEDCLEIEVLELKPADH